ncbi:MAG: hypothetical protein QNL87_04710 [Gammaproteobacteria bacterium]|nr:hypothetical protein [Gammaproteobacteria bacterium]
MFLQSQDDCYRIVNGHAVWSNDDDNSQHALTGSGVDTTTVVDGCRTFRLLHEQPTLATNERSRVPEGI